MLTFQPPYPPPPLNAFQDRGSFYMMGWNSNPSPWSAQWSKNPDYRYVYLLPTSVDTPPPRHQHPTCDSSKVRWWVRGDVTAISPHFLLHLSPEFIAYTVYLYLCYGTYSQSCFRSGSGCSPLKTRTEKCSNWAEILTTVCPTLQELFILGYFFLYLAPLKSYRVDCKLIS
jgi:hypothetical protein